MAHSEEGSPALVASCRSPAGDRFEAEIRRPSPSGVFLQVDRELSQGETLELLVHDGNGTTVNFTGTVMAWVRGRGVRVEAIPGTPPEILDQLLALSQRVLEVSQSTDLALQFARPRSPARKQAAGRTVPGALPAARTALAGTRVLVIDDDPGIVKLMQRALTRFGCEVTGTQNPPLALELAESSDTDVILLDWMLPKIPGAEMLDRLRQARQDRPVAVISGALWWDQAAEQIRSQGASEVLEKPVDFERLVAWLQGVASSASSR
jgi:CheY-like chemotaxis protein